MSFTWLMVLTVVEVVLLVAVLAGYLIALTVRLDSVAKSLAKVAWGVRAVESEVSSIGPSVTRINGVLAELTEDVLPGVAAKAERLTG
jgi:uncharacterized protein YoxC